MLRSNTAERLRALTHALVSGMVEAPNNTRRNRRLCRAPHGEKSGFSCSCHQSTSWGVGTYRQGDVRVSARPRRL